MRSVIGILGRGVLPVVAVVLVYYQKTPVAYAWRSYEPALLLGLLGLSGLSLVGVQRGILRVIGALLLFVLLFMVLCNEGRFARHATRVAKAPVEQRQRLGRHFIVGFAAWPQIEKLAVRGDVGGIYLARRNVAGLSVSAVRRRIDALQSRRRRAGLPLLLVTTDQEGGSVARLSPPLPRLDAPASLLPLVAAARADHWPVNRWAGFQARGLAAMGVNVNFSPVVDLKPPPGISPANGHTQLHRRAISAAPSVVTTIGAGVCRAYEREGVLATVKHFPGLQRVREETHIEAGRLDQSPDELMHSDWMPFREITRHTQALMMLGHVRLTRIDPDLPASFSRQVVQQVIRRQWQHEGVLITDDLNMGPAYGHPGGIGASAVKALNAGVDLLLIAYDPDQYYRAMDAVLCADADGRLDHPMLRRSARRLDRILAWLGHRTVPAKDRSAAAQVLRASAASQFTTEFKMID